MRFRFFLDSLCCCSGLRHEVRDHYTRLFMKAVAEERRFVPTVPFVRDSPAKGGDQSKTNRMIRAFSLQLDDTGFRHNSLENALSLTQEAEDEGGKVGSVFKQSIRTLSTDGGEHNCGDSQGATGSSQACCDPESIPSSLSLFDSCSQDDPLPRMPSTPTSSQNDTGRASGTLPSNELPKQSGYENVGGSQYTRYSVKGLHLHWHQSYTFLMSVCAAQVDVDLTRLHTQVQIVEDELVRLLSVAPRPVSGETRQRRRRKKAPAKTVVIDIEDDEVIDDSSS